MVGRRFHFRRETDDASVVSSSRCATFAVDVISILMEEPGPLKCMKAVVRATTEQRGDLRRHGHAHRATGRRTDHRSSPVKVGLFTCHASATRRHRTQPMR
jgi:hypothetical protein